MVGGLFAVKEDATNIYLVSPRSGSHEYVYVYKYDVATNQWSVLNTTGSLPNCYWGNQTGSNPYWMYKNHLVTSNELSSWILSTAYCYNDTQQYYSQQYYAFNPADGSFVNMVGYSHTSQWYGIYGFTLTGAAIWHASTGDSKLYYNDMVTMAYDVTNKYLEQFLNDPNKYIWMQQNSCQYAVAIFNIDPASFENRFMVRIMSSNIKGAVY